MADADTNALPHLEAVWATGEALLAAFEPAEDAHGLGRLTVAGGDDQLADGQLVALTIRLVDRQAEFRVHARVLGREGDRYLLRFVERGRQELVLTCAAGRTLRYRRRRYARVACFLPAELVLDDGQRLPATATSVAEGGAGLLLADAPVAEGDAVRCAVRFAAGEEPRQIPSRVVAVVGGPEPGLALEFAFESADQREALWQAVRVLRDRTERDQKIPG